MSRPRTNRELFALQRVILLTTPPSHRHLWKIRESGGFMKKEKDFFFVTLLTTGGTIERIGQGPPTDYKAELFDYLKFPHLSWDLQSLMSKDSRDMSDADRRAIVLAIKEKMEKGHPLVLLHGTDTMEVTLEWVQRDIDVFKVPVVFTGAMVPPGDKKSDALQNVTEALMAAQCLPRGIYLSFHGSIFPVPPGAVKNKEKGIFERKISGVSEGIMSTLTAINISDYFTNKAIEEKHPLTIMQALRLTYIAQGFHLSLMDKPFFQEEIHAWKHGPVVKNLYDHLSKISENYIIKKKQDINDIHFEKKQLDILNVVFGKYAKLQAWDFSGLTYKKGTPWEITYKNNPEGDGVIKKELIKSHFKKMITDYSFSVLLSESQS